MAQERAPKWRIPGPKPGIVHEYFDPVGEYEKDTSKRQARQCKACKQVIPAYKAKAEELILHIVSRCKAITPADRVDFTTRHAAELGAQATTSARETMQHNDLVPSM